MNKIKSDGGGGANYYDLPKKATQLQDLIEHRNMNGNIKDIFKACYRMGLKDGTTDDYDMRKMVYYSLRELGRVDNRKDYLTLAEEIIGHQHEETMYDEVIEHSELRDQYSALLKDDEHQANMDLLNGDSEGIFIYPQRDGSFIVDRNGHDDETVMKLLKNQFKLA